MTDKKTESLKLALEALEYISSHYMSLPKIGCMALAAVEEALAEQPAQQDMPKIGCVNHDCDKCKAQQQEPVATDWERIARVQDAKLMAMCNEHGGFEKLCEVMDKYERTSPPASKPWVGLTDEEMRDLEKQFNAERVRTSDEEYLIIYPGDYWAWQRAIEAKLREKNA